MYPNKTRSGGTLKLASDVANKPTAKNAPKKKQQRTAPVSPKGKAPVRSGLTRTPAQAESTEEAVEEPVKYVNAGEISNDMSIPPKPFTKERLIKRYGRRHQKLREQGVPLGLLSCMPYVDCFSVDVEYRQAVGDIEICDPVIRDCDRAADKLADQLLSLNNADWDAEEPRRLLSSYHYQVSLINVLAGLDLFDDTDE
ncbi:hypothetical protein EJ08DRAFT_665496 [Tothia fuscella]|uniref:Uncharacterized protein n=1 Tax=Tothia fuscella TaxID=1048955 RepID=A0A9P4NGH5_9PEZI|nr:hypothetical protein EJ08DRAFT_665496 [Tothia fuscella]